MSTPTANSLVYSGTNRELISAVETADGTVLYSLDGETYSTAVPAGKDAGDYTVYYKVKGDENHLDSETAQISVSISKADIPLEVYILSRSVDDEPSDPLVYGNTGSGDITYEYKPRLAGDGEYTAERPEEKGVYTVRATAKETKNYKSATAENDFVILPSWSSREYSMTFIYDSLIVTAPQSGPCTVVFASYKNGALQKIDSKEMVIGGDGVGTADIPEHMKEGEPDEIRAMLWSSLADMVPLCKTESYMSLR